MSSEISKLLAREKEIIRKSPAIHGAVAVVFLLFGLVLMVGAFLMPPVGGLCGACFGIASMAFVSRLTVVQEKLNLELAKKAGGTQEADSAR